MPQVRVPKKIGPPSKTNRLVPKNRPDLRSNNAGRLIAMRAGKLKRDEKGNIVKGSVLSDKDKNPVGGMHRIAPDRRWFGSTRVISQSALQQFKDEMNAAFHDPYSVVINYSKLPTQLLQEPKHDDSAKPHNKIEFGKTFGTKSIRKRPKLMHFNTDAMAAAVVESAAGYKAEKDKQTAAAIQERLAPDSRDARQSDCNKAGQSGRIWGELYKVIDSSDVVLQVIDARDPMGTRCAAVERYMKKEKKYKHLVLVLNKCDLIPTWAAKRWIAILSKEYPTIAFHASVTNPFGKGNLISLIRQFARLHKNNNKKMISVGLIGYPNVGKSSVINAIRGKKVCKVAPIPGETKVWQYVALTKRVFLIDCPGVIHFNEGNDETQSVLKSVVRVEKLTGSSTADHVKKILEMVDKQKLVDTYGIDDWGNHIEFLQQIAVKRGKLLPGGIADIDTTARSILYDWQRGRVPWFLPPPMDDEDGDTREDDNDEDRNNLNSHLRKIKPQRVAVEEGADADAADADDVQAEEGDEEAEEDAMEADDDEDEEYAGY